MLSYKNHNVTSMHVHSLYVTIYHNIYAYDVPYEKKKDFNNCRGIIQLTNYLYYFTYLVNKTQRKTSLQH